MTPGISPRNARARKQMRHIWNFRSKPRERPQIRHRPYRRTLNLGSRCCFMIRLVLAMVPLDYLRNGKPRRSRRDRASSSFLAEVSTQMSMPRVISTLS